MKFLKDAFDELQDIKVFNAFCEKNYEEKTADYRNKVTNYLTFIYFTFVVLGLSIFIQAFAFIIILPFVAAGLFRLMHEDYKDELTEVSRAYMEKAGREFATEALMREGMMAELYLMKAESELSREKEIWEAKNGKLAN